MSDDGTGSGIRIPSMLIGKDDGRKIVEFMEKFGATPSTKGFTPNTDDDVEPDDIRNNQPAVQIAPKYKPEIEQAQIIITFMMENPDNRVEYDIWYTSTDDRALDFIDNFIDYDKKFGDKVLMTPHFVTFDCQDCDAEFKKKECFDNGKFCALNHKNVK